MNSVWFDGANRPTFESLRESRSTDVLIIGGGIAGILCAYGLKSEGVDCILLEADEICRGVTAGTTAKITFQHGAIYDKLIKRFGIERAGLYLRAQKDACDKYEELCQKIPCDYEKKSSCVYSLDRREKMEKEKKALERLGVEAEFEDDCGLPFPTAGAVRVKNQAQFNPLKLLYGIAKELPIYENTKVTELLPHGAKTQYGEIICKKIIVATHFPILNKHGSYFLKMYQHRSYVLALEGAPLAEGMYVDEAENGLSFRSFKNMLLLGGGDHRTGKKGGNWRELEEFAKTHYKDAEIVKRWAAQDCMTLDGVPYIGRYSKNTPDLYVASGFNKWGVTSSMVSSTILADLVMERSNRYAAVFSPSRSMLHPQLAVNAFEAAVNMLTPTVPRCPHLGCALKYNPDEHSWDCPCHGSRFSKDGELLDNPATDGKKNMK